MNTKELIQSYLLKMGLLTEPSQADEYYKLFDNIMSGVQLTGRYEAILSRMPTSDENDVILGVLSILKIKMVGTYETRPLSGVVLTVSWPDKENLLRNIGGAPINS